MHATLLYLRDPAFQMITVTKETGLGLKILGGINRNEGPLVYIQEIIPGGDCYKVKMKIKITLHLKDKTTSDEVCFPISSVNFYFYFCDGVYI